MTHRPLAEAPGSSMTFITYGLMARRAREVRLGPGAVAAVAGDHAGVVEEGGVSGVACQGLHISVSASSRRPFLKQTQARAS